MQIPDLLVTLFCPHEIAVLEMLNDPFETLSWEVNEDTVDNWVT